MLFLYRTYLNILEGIEDGAVVKATNVWNEMISSSMVRALAQTTDSTQNHEVGTVNFR